MRAKKKVSLYKKQSITGWAFLLPATLLIFAMNFYPMLQAFILSFKTGIGNNMMWGGLGNYLRLLKDGVFHTAITNNFFYLIIQVPVMLILAIFLACLLNRKGLTRKRHVPDNDLSSVLYGSGILFHYFQDFVCL